MPKFSSATAQVDTGDFEEVLKMLEPPKVWANHPSTHFARIWISAITDNLNAVRSNLSQFSFEIFDEGGFAAEASRLSLVGLPPNTRGVTDKKTHTILLLRTSNGHTQDDIRAGNASPTLLEALHECVHLVTYPVFPFSRTLHPPPQPCSKTPAPQGTPKQVLVESYARLLGQTLDEGMTELITEQILESWGFSLPGPEERGHFHRLPAASQLLQDIGVDTLANLLFRGQSGPFSQRAQDVYGVDGWKYISASQSAGVITVFVLRAYMATFKEKEKARKAQEEKDRRAGVTRIPVPRKC